VTDELAIRRLGAADAEPYRQIRHEALERHPEAFASSLEEELRLSVADYAERLTRAPPAAVFGAFEGERLVGTAGVYAHSGLKVRHGGVLWGVYIRQAWRGSGVAERLARTVVRHAGEAGLEVLELTVGRDNRAAYTLYERLGFTPYGVRDDALKVDGRYVAEVLMLLRL
jgi:RimJ/RimL family protein N-acetyltransferase